MNRFVGTSAAPSGWKKPSHLRDAIRDRNKKRRGGSSSLDARYASLLAFAESRDCGQDNDGKFSKGNTCATGIAADAAKGAAKGAALGALAGFAKTFLPQVAASHAAVGAVAGAVKGIYDNQMKPTRVSDRITRLGMTDEGVANIVKSLGGSKNSVASTTGRARLTVKVKNRDGKVTHVVDFTNKTLTIYPKKAGKELSDSELQAVKESRPPMHRSRPSLRSRQTRSHTLSVSPETVSRSLPTRPGS